MNSVITKVFFYYTRHVHPFKTMCPLWLERFSPTQYHFWSDHQLCSIGCGKKIITDWQWETFSHGWVPFCRHFLNGIFSKWTHIVQKNVHLPRLYGGSITNYNKILQRTYQLKMFLLTGLLLNHAYSWFLYLPYLSYLLMT